MAEKNNQNQAGEQQQNLSQLLQVRRDKLKELQASGNDPFQITRFDVTAHTADIKNDFDNFEGKEVVIYDIIYRWNAVKEK